MGDYPHEHRHREAYDRSADSRVAVCPLGLPLPAGPNSSRPYALEIEHALIDAPSRRPGLAWGPIGRAHATVSALAIPQVLETKLDELQAFPRLSARARAKRESADPADSHARWQTVEVRHLAALAAVAREGSFRRAADRLGYVQSAISGQIAHLERSAGTRLVERASGTPTVRLTSAGLVLLSHIDEIIARLNAAHAELNSLAERTAGTLRLAGHEQISPSRLARVLRLFRQRHPAANVRLEDPGSEELAFELLASGTVDVIICELPLLGGPFGHVVLERDPYVLLVNVDASQFRRGNPPSAAEIASDRLMVASSSRSLDQLEDRLRELGIERRSPLHPESVAMSQSLVAAGLGEAIVPAQLIDPTDPHTVAIELGSLLPDRTVALAFSTDHERPPVIDGFIRAAKVGCDAERARLRRHAHLRAADGRVPRPQDD
jgi:DNA-binding transcriptional LysR family regulator